MSVSKGLMTGDGRSAYSIWLSVSPIYTSCDNHNCMSKTSQERDESIVLHVFMYIIHVYIYVYMYVYVVYRR